METAEQILQSKGGEMITVSPEYSIHDAIKKINDHKIGAVLVKDGAQICGIWTERDLLRNIMEPDFDLKTKKIKDYMQTQLKSAPHDMNPYQLMDLLLGRRHRHTLIEKDGKYIGFLSMGDIVKSALKAKDQDLKEFKAKVTWSYYEDWN